MFRNLSRLVLLLAPVALIAGCEQTKSSNPLSPFIAGPMAGITIDPPGPVTPTPATEIPFPQQPITLTVNNAFSNGPRPVSYVFEISIDPNFGNTVFTQTGVAQGESRTSFQLPQALPPERTYYWHAKGDDGANFSEFSQTYSFRVFTPVVIQPPTLKEPGEGTTLPNRRPTLVIGNSTRTGPAGTIQYIFEVATDAGMGNRVVSQLVAEGSGDTSFTVPNDLATNTRHFWRVKATDGKNQSDFSGIRSFITPAAPVTTPPNSPSIPPSGAPAAADMISLSGVPFLNSPADLGSWPITSKLDEVHIRPSGIHVEFSKRMGPNRWPDVRPPGWDGDLQYTLGMCLRIGGKWHCSAVVQFWHGLEESGGEPWNYAINWFYDPIRWAPMTGHQPAPGETIGIFVCAGDCRNNPKGDLSPAKERTNIVTLPMPGNGGGVFKF